MKKLISLKLKSGGLTKVRGGWKKIEKLISRGTYLAPESMKHEYENGNMSFKKSL